MGCSPLFCCFKDKSPLCVSITGLISTIIPFAFLIWGLADIIFFKDSGKAFYILTFILICVCLVLFIIFIVINFLKGITCSKIGRVLCVVLLILIFIALVFMIIAFIITLKDYVDLEKDVDGKFWGNKDWCVVIFPIIITIICLIIMAKCANYLYKCFVDRISTYPKELNQKSETSIPNTSQPAIFPNNNQSYPVNIQQSETNFNNK